MPYLNDLADILRAGGIGVWEEPNWKRRNHGALSRVQGILCHHTAGGGSSDWLTVMNGRPGLAGPLAQLTLERDGGVRVLSNGVAWHAGSGSHPDLPGASNYTLIGIEGVSPGTGSSPWTPAQVAAYPKVVAALCRGYKVPVSSVLGHFEWATPRGRKIDPWSPTGGRPWDMNHFRSEVARHLGNQPKPEEDWMSEAHKKMIEIIFDQITGPGNAGRVIANPNLDIAKDLVWGWESKRYLDEGEEQARMTIVDYLRYSLDRESMSRIGLDGRPTDVKETLRGDLLNIAAELKGVKDSASED